MIRILKTVSVFLLTMVLIYSVENSIARAQNSFASISLVKDHLKSISGTEWNIHWDYAFKRPRAVIGLVPVDHGITDIDEGRDFIHEKIVELAEVLKIDTGQIEFDEQRPDPVGFSYIYIQYYNGIPVENGRVSGSVNINYENGFHNIYISNNFFPGIDLDADPVLKHEDIKGPSGKMYEQFLKRVKASPTIYSNGSSYIEPPSLVVYPKVAARGRDGKPLKYDYFLAWKIFYYRCVVVMDAHTGEKIDIISSLTE